MTFLIACLLLTQMDAHPLAYVGTTVLWFLHLGAHSK